MRLRSRRALLSLVLAVGLVGGTAVAAGAATTVDGTPAEFSGAPQPSPVPGAQVAAGDVTGTQQPAPATTAGAQTAAVVPSGKLPREGLPMPTAPAGTLTVPATVSAPVFGAAVISGSTGVPRPGVQVIAEQQLGGGWTPIGSAATDGAGAFRISTTSGDGRLGAFTVRVRTADASLSAAGSTPAVQVTRRFADPHQRLSDSQVRTIFRNHGLSWRSSGNCTTRSRSNCTSFDQMRASTVTETITLQQRSGCPIVVTGGTEVGHASGTYSHYNGYKIDWQMSSCVTSYVLRNGRSIGGSKWTIGSTVYYNERNHWDVQTRP